MFFLGCVLASTLSIHAQVQSSKDSLTMESMMHNLPEVMVKGSRPIVKAERGMLLYNMPLLLKQLPADNAYEALTRIPGVSDATGGISLLGNAVTLIINGQATTLTQEQLAERLKAMPAAQLAKAEVMLSAPARYHVRGMAINIVTKDYAGTNRFRDRWLVDCSKANIQLALAILPFPCKEASLDWMQTINTLTAIHTVSLRS